MVTSMQEIADLAGLSRATVSDVIRNRWRQKGISQKTHDRVQAIIAQYNYRPNVLAQGLAAQKTYTVGVHLPSFLYEHWSAVQMFLDKALRKRGYRALWSSPSVFRTGTEEDEIRMLCDRQVDGLIVGAVREVHRFAIFDWIQARKIPFVCLGNTPRADYYAVVDDNKSQARLAVEHLIRLGHKRIAYLHGSSGTIGERERRRGYLETLRDYGLPIRQDYMTRSAYDLLGSREAAAWFLSLPEPPTAIYAAADTGALGLIEGITAKGLRVPEDVAVVGHADDIPFVSMHRVPLTTIRQPRQHLAEMAAWMLLDLIEGRQPIQPVIRLAGELIVRESCGAKKGIKG